MQLGDRSCSVFAGLLGIGLLCLGTVGCNGSGTNKTFVDVQGKVQIDGAPLPEGTIVFLPADSAASGEAGVISNGTYSTKVSLGEKRVEIRAPKSRGKETPMDGMPAEMMPEVMEETLPEKFNSKSDLKCNIEGPNNALNFDLQSK